jgi:predicted ATPase
MTKVVQAASQPVEANGDFQFGSTWLRADFHLHTRADKEFKYVGQNNDFVAAYVSALEQAGIRLGVITNHNKFDLDEFKALRKAARKRGIGLLPGVELSVNDGSNGVHTLIVFSEDWIAEGKDYINPFLTTAFAGRTPDQYENENARSNDDIVTTLTKLEKNNKDFFVVFAHVETSSGLWNELQGGRLEELAKNPLVQRYCLGFQKVRTHDKPDAKCRMKVQGWWGERYPAEVEGSDPKAIEEIGRGQQVFVKIGDLSFNAVKFALTDFAFRVDKAPQKIGHSHVNAIRFEGGLLDGVRVPFSPNLNCLIGIQGSGKSSVLESLRYALNIPFGDKAEDKDYKTELLPHVLKSGGKIIVEATDRHGTQFEIRRIWQHDPDVYVEGKLRPGVNIRETIVCKPLYFGQKDLSAAGKGFGQDLVEKLVGDSLAGVRAVIAAKTKEVKDAVDAVLALQGDLESKETLEHELKDVEFRLEQFDKHGLKAQLEKQIELNNDAQYCDGVEERVDAWTTGLSDAVSEAKEAFADIEPYTSKYNAPFFLKYEAKVNEILASIAAAEKHVEGLEKLQADLATLRGEFDATKDGLKEEFAETERKLVKALEKQNVTSIQPDAYVDLTRRKSTLTAKIADLKKKTAKANEKQDALASAIAALNEAWLAEFKEIKVALDRINGAQPALKVEATFKGDRASFVAKLDAAFRGNNIRKETYQGLSGAYIDFAAMYKEIEQASGYAKGKADTFKELFASNLVELLSYQVPNSYDVTYHGKPLKSHSLGQRASAMMLFLLSRNENDLLLIDQPEDDLDSQTVYEEVVKLIRGIKSGQQFIFATHNANFPVLGDAELIAACSSENDVIAVACGSIDAKDSQEKIVRIMEGGEEAFERRKAIYQSWKQPLS